MSGTSTGDAASNHSLHVASRVSSTLSAMWALCSSSGAYVGGRLGSQFSSAGEVRYFSQFSLSRGFPWAISLGGGTSSSKYFLWMRGRILGGRMASGRSYALRGFLGAVKGMEVASTFLFLFRRGEVFPLYGYVGLQVDGRLVAPGRWISFPFL